MPFDTAMTAHQSFFETACEIVAGPRPVSHADLAGFYCGGRLNKDGTPRADYGCVYYRIEWNGSVTYCYHADGRGEARNIRVNAPTEGFVEIERRSFRIAGAVSEKAVA